MTRILYIAILLTTACSSGQEEGIAHITQRRITTEGKLVVSYRFLVNGKWVYDSVELRNRVIPHDSVTVKYQPDHPEESSLLVP